MKLNEAMEIIAGKVVSTQGYCVSLHVANAACY